MIFARLRPENPFFAIHPGGVVPLLDRVARMRDFEEHGRLACFMADVQALTPDVLDLVVEQLSGGDATRAAEVFVQFTQYGFPVRLSQTLGLVEGDSPAGPFTPVDAVPETPEALDLRNF